MRLRVSTAKLVKSTLAPFNFVQRVCSYLVWVLVLLVFLFFELTGLLPFTPWRTLSETGWDAEKAHPGVRRKLCGFLFGLAVHIRYRDTMMSSYEWGLALVDELEKDGH